MSKKTSRSKRRPEQPARRLTRRSWIGSAVSIAVLGGLGVALKGGWRGRGEAKNHLGTMTVYKSPTCQCCERWVQLMREAGFTVAEENRADVTPIKRERGVPNALVSCHTGLIDGYVFEGHVPPDLVQQVLRDRPAFAGLAVPGMPQSAPGMDIGRERYEVISFTRSGETATYAVRS
ncbi:MAG: DUF411 domain-containing protein [Gemmatimonadota bacterium]